MKILLLKMHSRSRLLISTLTFGIYRKNVRTTKNAFICLFYDYAKSFFTFVCSDVYSIFSIISHLPSMRVLVRVSISRLSVTKRLFKGDNTKMKTRVHWKNVQQKFKKHFDNYNYNNNLDKKRSLKLIHFWVYLFSSYLNRQDQKILSGNKRLSFNCQQAFSF